MHESEPSLSSARSKAPSVVIVGGGPAGLIAAQRLRQAGAQVTLYDAMASVGRKFLLAGKGGLNLTHSEPLPTFLTRYGAATPNVEPWLQRFGPESVRDLVRALGYETFTGSSGRVFPSDMKAGPLLRTWLRHLREEGTEFRMRHRFTGWGRDGSLTFDTPDGPHVAYADIVLLALGGGSWAKLGSDGTWVESLRGRGVDIAPLKPANCGFESEWSVLFASRFAGQPLKSICARPAGSPTWKKGELMITAHGIEGSLVYALSAPLRDALEQSTPAFLELDLMPDRHVADIESALSNAHGKRSRSEHWRRSIGLTGVKAGLVLECLPREHWNDAAVVARTIKRLPLALAATRPIDEAISTAGGVCFDAVDERLMLRAWPGMFVAGEMLDWEAPTGGYLLTAALASGMIAAEGALAWWQEQSHAL